jgi:DNA repair photolyase
VSKMPRWRRLSIDGSRAQGKGTPGLTDAYIRSIIRPMGATTYHPLISKSAVNRVTGMPFNWSLNPYRGCVHACHYCYARATHTYFGLNADGDFEREIFAKTNIAVMLDKDLSRPSWKGESIAIGTATDAYQPVEGHLKLTRACLEQLIRHRNPATVVTKSRLVARDIDLWQELATVAEVRVYFTITTLDDEIWRRAEPGTPRPMLRLETLRAVSQAGIPTGVLMAPVLPGITDSETSILSVAEAVAKAGASSFTALPLRLDPFVREHYYDWIARSYPDLMRRYDRSFTNRHTSKSYQERIKAISNEARARFGLDERRMSGTAEQSRPSGMIQLSLSA